MHLKLLLSICEFSFASWIRTLEVLFLYWDSMLILSDLLFLENIFTYILCCILVEGRCSRTEQTQKWNHLVWNSSYFESWYNFQYLSEGTAVSISCYKRNFWFELLYSKDNLADQINKNNFKNNFEHLF